MKSENLLDRGILKDNSTLSKRKLKTELETIHHNLSSL